MAFALSIPNDGTIVACDVTEQYVQIGIPYWEQAGVRNKIDFRLGPAVETLSNLVDAQRESFDWIYIDADKENYLEYYKLGKELVRKGGLILVDNVLWRGTVCDLENKDKVTETMRKLNDFIAADESVESVLIPLSDGLTICIKE